MIYTRDINLLYGERPLFKDISFSIDESQRVGLVGLNGSGKSTLLKAINDPSMLDSGIISVAGNKKIAYMPQDVVLTSTKTIIEETCTAFQELTKLQIEATHLEHIIDQHNQKNLPIDHAVIDRYATLSQELLNANPEQMRARAQRMLEGLGFDKERIHQPTNELSVGWRMRVVLAKLLLQDADFYLFDEPTNHLDLIAKEWFLGFLKNASFGFMIVCHEKYFLNELCTDILELEYGKGTIYHGNYDAYETQKEENFERLKSAYDLQQKEIARKKETIERFRASASKAKMAQSMLRELEKIELITLPPSTKKIGFSFPPITNPGRIVLLAKNISHSFGEKSIFKNVSFQIERGEKVAVVAPNGVGKTTLFNVLVGALKLQHGTLEWGDNVKHAIFAQDQNKALDPNRTILETAENHCSHNMAPKIRTMLGCFLFSGNDVKKNISMLSGGEKNRIAMVNILLQNANVLLLDEPTNHLDIPSKEILLNALRAYPGTIIFVSHDRDFINDVATSIIELTPQGTQLYQGNYDSYIYQKEFGQKELNISSDKASLAQNTKQDTKQDTKKQSFNAQTSQLSSKERFELSKKLRNLERTVQRLEEKITEKKNGLTTLTYGTDEFFVAQREVVALEEDLAKKTREWEDFEKKLGV